MELQEKKINIKSKLFQEVYQIHWTIGNFSMLPFKEHNPIRSPCFFLGEHVDTAWSLFMSKQMQDGVGNVGFKLVRTEDEADWNSATISLSVVVEDGRIVKFVDKEVLGGESQNRYAFLIRPSKSRPKNGTDASTQVENSRGLEGSATKSKTVTVCDHDCFIVDRAFCSFEEAKKRNEQEDVVSKPDVVSGSPKVESGRSLNLAPKMESCRIEDSEVKTGEIQQDGAELTPEELIQLKDLTVVCVIEYTYMKCNKLEKTRRESVGSDLKEAFKHLDDTGNFSDITLKCNDVYFPCHKAVLAPLSSVFDKLLQSENLPNPLTVNLHMPLHLARAFVMYMYIRELPDCLSANDYRQLCKIADHFGVEGMKKSCLLMQCIEAESSEEEEVGEVRKSPKLLYSIAS